jgi:anti-sigma factor RsiW
MDCHLYRLLMQRYYDGELESAERAAFENHRRGCEACRAEDAAFAAVFSLLESVPRFEPRSDFDARVLARVDVAAYRVRPARKAANAIDRAWNAVPAPLRNAAVIVASAAFFITLYRPLLMYLVSVVGGGAASAWSGVLFMRALAEKMIVVTKGSGTLRNYEVVGQTLQRTFLRMLGGMHPHEMALVIVSIAVVVAVIYRMASARRKGETHVGIV